MPDDVESTSESARSLGSLLAEGLQTVVFGNGYLIVLIGVVFVAVVMLSHLFKGGDL